MNNNGSLLNDYKAGNETARALVVDGTVVGFLPLLDLHRILMINYRHQRLQYEH